MYERGLIISPLHWGVVKLCALMFMKLSDVAVMGAKEKLVRKLLILVCGVGAEWHAVNKIYGGTQTTGIKRNIKQHLIH